MTWFNTLSDIIYVMINGNHRSPDGTRTRFLRVKISGPTHRRRDQVIPTGFAPASLPRLLTIARGYKVMIRKCLRN